MCYDRGKSTNVHLKFQDNRIIMHVTEDGVSWMVGLLVIKRIGSDDLKKQKEEEKGKKQGRNRKRKKRPPASALRMQKKFWVNCT